MLCGRGLLPLAKFLPLSTPQQLYNSGPPSCPLQSANAMLCVLLFLAKFLPLTPR